MKQLITIKRLPEIEAHLQALSGQIDDRVSSALSLAVTEETVKEVKKVRAELNKESAPLKEEFRAAESKILQPWYEFKETAKSLVFDKYVDADLQLKNRISEVEDGLKAKKHAELAEYFDELLTTTGIDFVTMGTWNPNVTLSVTLPALKKQASEFVSKIADDVAAIENMENSAEILVEYKKCSSLAQAVSTVIARHKAVKSEKRRQEDAKQAQTVADMAQPLPPQAQAVQEIVKVKFESKSNPGTYSEREYSYFTAIPLVVGDIVLVPVKNGEGKAIVTETDVLPFDVGCDISLLKSITAKHEKDPVHTIAITVTASLSKLKELKAFLVDGGYRYE